MAFLKVLFLLFTAFVEYSSQLEKYEAEQLRVLDSHLKEGLILTCPETGSPSQFNTIINEKLVVWVNEVGQSEKPDSQVSVTSENLLTPNRPTRFEYVFNRPFSDISCGYFIANTNKYVRIKRWKLSYVDTARVALDFAINDSYFKIKTYNQTFHKIDYLKENSTLGTIVESGNIIRPYCKVNFDLPLSTTLIWLQYQKYENNKLVVNEAWRRLDSGKFESRQDFLDGENRAIEFISLLRNLFNNPDNSVTLNLQCATYVTGDTIKAQTGDYFLIKGSAKDTDDKKPTGGAGGLTETELILTIIFSILGFFILLGLLILLIYCCCCGLCCPWCYDKNKNRKRTSYQEKSTTVSKNRQQKSNVVPIPIQSINDSFEVPASPRTFRSSVHLDNINYQMDPSLRFHNDTRPATTSLHVTSIPTAQRNDLLVKKNSFPPHELSKIYEDDGSYYYSDNTGGKNFIYQREDFYESTITSTGRAPLELIHQV